MPEPVDVPWNEIRAALREEAGDFTFHLWLEPLELAELSGDLLVLRAPEHVRTWAQETQLPLIRSVATRVLSRPVAVEVVGADWQPGAGANASVTPQQPSSRLNPKYSFEQFVICDGNRLAHAAALVVAEQPSQAYNPLFLHGRPGLGKTHLLHAIGNYIQAHGAGMRVRYATLEEFTAEFVGALRGGDARAFRDRFRSTDVLLVDDVQFLAGKGKTQEEFFHTFNALLEAGSQLVVTSDRPPSELAELETRLIERFGSGLIATVEPPDVEARLAMLRARARLDDLAPLPEATLRELARFVKGSVRTLEGALIRVVAYASLRGEEPSPGVARRVLEGLYGAPASAAAPTVGRIQEETAEALGVRTETLLSQDRGRKVTWARHVAMYLARELTEEPLPAIGRSFGGRDHSTVIHACRKVARFVAEKPDVRAEVDAVRERLAGTS